MLFFPEAAIILKVIVKATLVYLMSFTCLNCIKFPRGTFFIKCFDVKQAVIVRPLSAVSALVRFAEEPQMFAIEFDDGCPIHVRIFCHIIF